MTRGFANFTFHVALSEPQPADQWTEPAEFIREVLRRTHLGRHPDPTRTDYCLCGPLPTIRAAIKMLADFNVPSEAICSDGF